MRHRRAIHGVVLNLALAAGAMFYLLSPTVYAYFSEVSMTYSRVPEWFASTAPAMVTERIFARYNADSPVAARVLKHLPCYLADAGATMHADCSHELGGGQLVYGPPDFKITSGSYIARFEFSRDGICSSGEVHLEVDTERRSDSTGDVTLGKLGKVLAAYTGRIEPGDRIELPFTLRLIDAALGDVEFRAVGLSQCVLLSRVELTEVPHEGSSRGFLMRVLHEGS
jgi:hypothetical protein